MHRSRLAGIIVDCETDDLQAAAAFWSAALGAQATQATESSAYVKLHMPADEPYVEVQAVQHPSRVHVDIESDDVAAEVLRLEKLGARKVQAVKDWVVMAAPTGQRFCVVPVTSEQFVLRANSWSD